MDNWKQIVVDIQNAGTIDTETFNEMTTNLNGFIVRAFIPLHESYGVSEWDKQVTRVFRRILQPYVLFHQKLETEEIEQRNIYNRLELNNRAEIINLLESIKDLPRYVFRQFEEKDVVKVITYLKDCYDRFYKVCRMYGNVNMCYTNMYKNEVEAWLKDLEVEYIPERKELQKRLREQEYEVGVELIERKEKRQPPKAKLPEMDINNMFRNLQEGQGTLINDIENVTAINNGMRERVAEGFEYFKKKYEADWANALNYVFSTITECNSQINSSSSLTEPYKTDLYIDAKNNITKIEAILAGIEGFFHFLKTESLDDTVKFLLFVEGLLVIYTRYCKEYLYDFEKSFFYEVVHKYYSKFKENYNSEALKSFRTNTNSLSIEESDKKVADKSREPDLLSVKKEEIKNNLEKETAPRIAQESEIKEVSSIKPTVKSYALLHVFWSKYDETKKITDTNKQKFSSDYNYSQNTLKQWFDTYNDEQERKPISEVSKAVVPFIKNFSDAVKMLETLCPEGFNEATKELESIKNRYLPKEN